MNENRKKNFFIIIFVPAYLIAIFIILLNIDANSRQNFVIPLISLIIPILTLYFNHQNEKEKRERESFNADWGRWFEIAKMSSVDDETIVQQLVKIQKLKQDGDYPDFNEMIRLLENVQDDHGPEKSEEISGAEKYVKDKTQKLKEMRVPDGD